LRYRPLDDLHNLPSDGIRYGPFHDLIHGVGHSDFIGLLHLHGHINALLHHSRNGIWRRDIDDFLHGVGRRPFHYFGYRDGNFDLIGLRHLIGHIHALFYYPPNGVGNGTFDNAGNSIRYFGFHDPFYRIGNRAFDHFLDRIGPGHGLGNSSLHRGRHRDAAFHKLFHWDGNVYLPEGFHGIGNVDMAEGFHGHWDRIGLGNGNWSGHFYVFLYEALIGNRNVALYQSLYRVGNTCLNQLFHGNRNMPALQSVVYECGPDRSSLNNGMTIVAAVNDAVCCIQRKGRT